MKPGTPERDYLDDMSRLIDALRRERDAVQTRRPLTPDLPKLLADVAKRRYDLTRGGWKVQGED